MVSRSYPASSHPFRELADWIQDDVGSTLGLAEAPGLPFLLKVLAAEKPLSLQVHPSPVQALEGFVFESNQKNRPAAAQRNYKDPWAKPEILVAVSDEFHLLAGFRTASEILDFATQVRARAGETGRKALAVLVSILEGSGGIRAALEWLLSGGRDVAQCVDALTLVARRGVHEENSPLAVISELVVHYPGDPGVVVGALMNRVTLKRGHGVFVPPGTMHAYLRGVGIELMTASDNVVRGGLTPKHVDHEELLRLLVIEQGPVRLLEPWEPLAGVTVFAPDAPFTLSEVGVTGPLRLALDGAGVALVESGVVRVVSGDACCELQKGDAIFIPYSHRDLHVSGVGRAWFANVGGRPCVNLTAERCEERG